MPDRELRDYRQVVVDGMPLEDLLRGIKVEADGFEMDPPEVSTSYVEVPGRSGSYDLTEALTGYPTYKDREMRMRFLVPMQGGESGRAAAESALTLASNALHGKRVEQLWLSWDPDYTYAGRMSVGELVRHRRIVGFELSVRCEPFKLKQHMSRTVDAAGGAWFYFESGRMPVVPVWTVYTSASIRKMGSDISYELGRGTYSLPDLLFTEGSNGVYIYAAGTGGEERLISSVASEAVSVYANVQIGDLMWVERPTNGRVRAEYDWKDL